MSIFVYNWYFACEDWLRESRGAAQLSYFPDTSEGAITARAMQTATLSIFRFEASGDRLWAFSQMALSRRALRRSRGLDFFKLLGTGVGAGFTPLPNTAVWAILGVWTGEARAREATTMGEAPFEAWIGRADEACTLFLSPIGSRGRWSGQEPFRPADPTRAGPVAVLTRATLRPRAMFGFWRREPPVSAAILANRDVLFRIGLGERPWMQQVTFSVWPDPMAVTRFARAGRPHAEAIAAARRKRWFAEELYARFAVVGAVGSWEGRDPLRAHAIEGEAA